MKALDAVNARPHVVTDYDVDPNNPSAGLLHDIGMRLFGFLTPVFAGGDTDPEGQFHGYGPQVQSFKGAANPGVTNVIRNGGYAEVSSAITAGPMGDPAMRIFGDRLRRRK